jgi:hypothetical protein
MRAAAHLAVSIIAIGAYLMIAATFVFSPTWIALGVLAVAAATAVALVSGGQHSAPTR